jgi:hypothetical protein
MPRLRCDLVRLANIWWYEQRIEFRPVAEIVERGVDAVFAGGALAEGEALVVGLGHDAGGVEGGEETVLARAEGGVDPREAAFGADVGDVVVDDVLQGVDVGVFELREVGGDVVVELESMSEDGGRGFGMNIRRPSRPCIRSHWGGLLWCHSPFHPLALQAVIVFGFLDPYGHNETAESLERA